VARVCAQRGGCDFAVYLGDNIYEVGATSADDPQFEAKFEQPYCGLEFPFFVVLGNHDYGNVAPLDLPKAEAQIAYTALSSKWKMPDHNYSVAFAEGQSTLELFVLDTPRLQFDVDSAVQASWLDTALGASTANWAIALGHHTYVSNGPHGNAGNYEGIIVPNPIARGDYLKAFFDGSLCGSVDLYLSGHDHNRQWLEASCGLEVLVSGAAAKRTTLVGRDENTTFFEEDQGYGFAVLEINGNQLIGRFYSGSGTQEFQRIITR
jgi:hypothetical protein